MLNSEAMNSNLNAIGLSNMQSTILATNLNRLLASYQVFYQNLRGFHWNIKGEKFFELHLKFEELYSDAVVKIDEVAERILTLGSTPLHTFSDYISVSEIEEVKDASDDLTTITTTLNNYRTLIIKERKLLKQAQDIDDEGTAALMSSYITQQENTVWMLSAYLNC